MICAQKGRGTLVYLDYRLSQCLLTSNSICSTPEFLTACRNIGLHHKANEKPIIKPVIVSIY